MSFRFGSLLSHPKRTPSKKNTHMKQVYKQFRGYEKLMHQVKCSRIVFPVLISIKQENMRDGMNNTEQCEPEGRPILRKQPF